MKDVWNVILVSSCSMLAINEVSIKGQEAMKEV